MLGRERVGRARPRRSSATRSGKKKEKGLAVAAERPGALFACAGTLVEALAPLARGRVRDALLRDGGRGELPRLDDEALAAFFKKTSRRPDPDVFGSSLAASFCAALSAATTAIVREDVLPATLANDATTTGVHADVPWLHLADECEAFDARVRAPPSSTTRRARIHRARVRARGRRFGGSAFSDARRSSSSAIADATARVAVVAHRYSAFAALATTAPRVTERWFAAERADGLRAVDAACDAPDDRGWRPEGAGVVDPKGGPGGAGYEEDPILDPFGGVVLSDSGDEGDHGVDSPRARFPAAEAAADALRRFCARAEAMPLHATCARDGLVDALDRLGGGLDSLNKARSSPMRGAFGGLPTHFAENDLNARFAYLSSAAFPLAEAFARRVRARASARDALPALPLGDGRAASLRVGACVASARVAADALSRLGEDAAVMQCAGADAFGEAAAAFDDDAEAWTRRLADAAADAFADAAAYYEGGAHVATFGRGDEAEGLGEEGDEGEEERRERRGRARLRRLQRRRRLPRFSRRLWTRSASVCATRATRWRTPPTAASPPPARLVARSGSSRIGSSARSCSSPQTAPGSARRAPSASAPTSRSCAPPQGPSGFARPRRRRRGWSTRRGS